jgi:hypothetical protein
MSELSCNPGQKKKPIVKNILLGVGCALAVGGSGALYQLPGMTPKVFSFVVGYWGGLPFVHLFTGHGFGFKKKVTEICR